MAKIYRRTDRITVQVDDITVKLAPLSLSQRMELQAYFTSGDLKEMMKGTKEVLKMTLKDMQGVEDSDGKKYELEFEDGSITEDCCEDIFNLEHSQKLLSVCSSLMSGVPAEGKVVDGNGKEIEGVTVVGNPKKGTRKSSR